MTSNKSQIDVKSFLNKDGIVIFLFHGVIEKQTYTVRNYTGKHIKSNNFEKYMSILATNGNPMTMNQVLHHLESGQNFLPGSFAITFDDGFENNISIARPILEKYKVPAMIYLTTDFIDNDQMSWIDGIEYAVQHTKKQQIRIAQTNKIYSLKESDEKIEFLISVRQFVKNSITCNPTQFSKQVCMDLGFSEKLSSDDPLDKKLTWDQIKLINRNDWLISFGGHSHTHPILSYLSHEDLCFELDTSLALLKLKADVNPIHYSYPEGLAHCYSKIVIDELKIRGVRCCPTAISGVNSLKTNPFELFRIMVA
jgi:peptidoglycan/xylan/chitin deacetylase (PgdA/CDA1 family)